MDTKNMGFDTQLVHAGMAKDAYGSAVVPIYQTSTFAFENAQNGADRFAGRADGFIYTRIGNPTVRALEKSIAELERGADAAEPADLSARKPLRFSARRKEQRSRWPICPDKVPPGRPV